MAEAVIKISELRDLADSLFERLKGQGFDHVEVKQSQYWKVYFANAFDVSAPSLVMGDIYDDLNDVRAEVKGSDDGDAVWHAFMHFSGLVNFVAYAAESGGLVKRTAMENPQ
ncbi:hypothetical protein [Mesorhizobium sp. 113-3-3]|uniref:hypothetical protein n=1 Tax=Mesorhizobium sp. 113-3-3 TaxID=2744516 RepID=UPI001928859D|nr:hypothetical protein [Mesorhizobium sp. 113-3-3]BCG80365.1 hypothetical protein MesoLj113b_39070 [Mesorhizobium sp. 113-3-3]